jgi:predicted restriction endonuclease
MTITTDDLREIVARKGQNIFKKALLDRSQQCELCKMNDFRLLIASHIKPWSNSSHLERLDINNGLLLCPNHDKLFDQGYITFLSDGTIAISKELSSETKKKMNTDVSMSIPLSENMSIYMEWHRNNIFKDRLN